jgi:UDP-sugar diphosphatase
MKIDTSKYPPEGGITLELCAGIVDKDLPLEEVARLEVLEECGYDVPVSNLERIVSYKYVVLAFCTLLLFEKT